MPDEVTLMGNYPNPFNPSTVIKYANPVLQEVSIAVYSAIGQRVTVLASGVTPAGWHSVSLDASGLPGGVYMYVLRAGGRTLSGKMVLLK